MSNARADAAPSDATAGTFADAIAWLIIRAAAGLILMPHGA